MMRGSEALVKGCSKLISREIGKGRVSRRISMSSGLF